MLQLQRMAGLLLPLFSLRREGDSGIGDLTALRQWVDWAVDQGLSFFQLLPVNALAQSETPSPYSAISSVALEPLYLSLDNVPGMEEAWLTGVAHLRPLQEPSGENLVDYENVRRYREPLLRRAWKAFCEKDSFATLRVEQAAWVAEQGDWLDDYACFRVAAAIFGTEAWWTWSEQDPQRIRELVRQDAEAQSHHTYQQWLQWLCFQQWGELRRYADSKGVMLMGDVPIGISVASADVFFEREQFDMSWSGGAPAEGNFAEDPFTGKWGQNWGIPLYRWDLMRQDGFRWWSRRIAKMAEVFAMYRIDHILGFYRIYAFPWMPDRNAEFLPLSPDEAAARCDGRRPGFQPRPDDSAENRKNNLMQGDDLLRHIMRQSKGLHVIGEDLGCVPDYVRPNLSQLRIAGFKIPHWLIDKDQHIEKGESYNRCSFATYATHDFPPISQDWDTWYGYYAQGHAAMKDESLSAEQKLHSHRVAHDCMRVLAWLGDFANIGRHENFAPWGVTIKNALFRGLFNCNSAYVALMWTELFDHPVRLNTPGTEGGRNWRERMPWDAAEAAKMEQSDWLRDLIIRTGRCCRAK